MVMGFLFKVAFFALVFKAVRAYRKRGGCHRYQAFFTEEEWKKIVDTISGAAKRSKEKTIEVLTQSRLRVATLGSSSFTFLDVDADGKACVSQNKELYETDNAYVLSIDVPGFKKDELTITVLDDIRELSVAGSSQPRTPSAPPRNINVRAVVPRKADIKKCTAVLDAGVMEISFPKVAVEGRQLSVQSRLYPITESENGFVKI